MTFTRSTDYRTIRALLMEPRAWVRMTGNQEPRTFDLERPGVEYILATVNSKPVAVFVIVEGIELHFCFVPSVWGSTLEIAQAFLEWLWSTTEIPLLVGPVPKRNRLALSLALRAGFKKDHEEGGLVYTTLERPVAA